MRLCHLLMSFILAVITSVSACADGLSFVLGAKRNDPSSIDLFPLILQTTNQGKTWFEYEIPRFLFMGGLDTGACSNTVCIVAGHNDDTYTGEVFQTNDGGGSWQKSVLPPETDNVLFYRSSACSDAICVILPSHYEGMFLQSTDSGRSWSVGYKNTAYDYTAAVDCVDDFCVVVGRRDDSSDAPALIQTQDAGKTWTRLALDHLEGAFNAVDCSSEVCTAVGREGPLSCEGCEEYVSDGPLILQTKDHGVTWEKMAVTHSKPGQSLNSVKCVDSHCIAVGNYNDSANTGLIIENTNSSFYKAIDVPSASALNDVDCSPTECFIVGDVYGSYWYEATYKSVLLSNLGGSWNAINIPQDASLGFLNRITCNNKLCFATGYYSTRRKGHDYFMIQNTGTGWESVGIQDIVPGTAYPFEGVTPSHS